MSAYFLSKMDFEEDGYLFVANVGALMSGNLYMMRLIWGLHVV